MKMILFFFRLILLPSRNRAFNSQSLVMISITIKIKLNLFKREDEEREEESDVKAPLD